MLYYLVYAQDSSGNSEQYDDKLTPEKCTDQRQHFGDSSGMHSLCGRRTRSEPFRFDPERELCQQCENKLYRPDNRSSRSL